MDPNGEQEYKSKRVKEYKSTRVHEYKKYKSEIIQDYIRKQVKE